MKKITKKIIMFSCLIIGLFISKSIMPMNGKRISDNDHEIRTGIRQNVFNGIWEDLKGLFSRPYVNLNGPAENPNEIDEANDIPFADQNKEIREEDNTEFESLLEEENRNDKDDLEVANLIDEENITNLADIEDVEDVDIEVIKAEQPVMLGAEVRLGLEKYIEFRIPTHIIIRNIPAFYKLYNLYKKIKANKVETALILAAATLATFKARSITKFTYNCIVNGAKLGFNTIKRLNTTLLGLFKPKPVKPKFSFLSKATGMGIFGLGTIGTGIGIGNTLKN